MRQSFFARRSFAIVLAVMFLLPFIWMGTRRTIRGMRNDVKEWLPDAFEETATYRWFQKHFPYEQFVLVSWEGCTLGDPRLELFARKLEHFDPNLKELGITGSLARRLEANGLDRRGAIEKHLERYGHLRSIEGISPEQADQVAEIARTWESPFKSPVLTGERLIDLLQHRYEDLTRQQVLERLEGSLIGRRHHPDCPRDETCQCPYDATCLVVTLSRTLAGRDLRQLLETIRRIADEECSINSEAIRLGGPPVDNVAIDVEGERTLYRLAGLSAIIGLTISMLCFRSVRLTVMVFWVAILSAGLGLAIVHFSGSNADAILMSMPSLLYVLTISGAIHIVNYYHDAIHERGLERAPEGALAHGFRPCTIAALTTALGLGSLMASHVIPISKFGVYSAVGVLASLFLLFLYLPALLHYFPSRRFAEKHAGKHHTDEKDNLFVRIWQRVGGVVIRHNLLVSGCCLAVMIFFAVGVGKMQTSVKLMKMFSPDAEIIAHYAWLEDKLGPLVPMEVVIKVDNQQNHLSFVERMRLVRDVEHAVEQLDAVGGALSAATFAPDIRPDTRRPTPAQKLLGIDPRVVRDGVLNRRMEPFREEFRDYLTYDFGKADALLETHDPTLAELGIAGPVAERLTARNLRTLKSIERFGQIEHIKGIGPEDAETVTEAIRRWRIAHGEELWRVCARVEALTDLDYAHFLDDLDAVVKPVLQYYQDHGVKGVMHVSTGMVPLVYKTQHELMRGLYESLALAFVLIAVVMIVVLRSISAGLLAMIPNLFPVVIIFGLLGWLGILVDAGSMMTASVALGVAVDDTIHYLTWFREGLDQGMARKKAAMWAYERCATAMTQTTLIAGFGLAAFAFSTFTPTQRFGMLMLILLFAALVGDLIFLPAVLTGPIGRFFRRRGKKATAEEPATAAASGQPEGEEPDTLPVEHAPTKLHRRADVSHPRRA